MSTKLIETSLMLIVWLFIATLALAQSDNPPVLDIIGQPVEVGKEYYIITALYDLRGRFTLIDRNNSCPLYVGQENTDLAKGLPVTFTPFATEDNKVIKVNRDFKVAFTANTTCAQSTQWKLGQRDPRSGRRLIITGAGNDTSNYFRIMKTEVFGVYNIRFCPTDVCPLCRFDCGTVGAFRELLNKILIALDGSGIGSSRVLPIQFVRA